MGRGDQLMRQWLILQRLRQGRCSRRELARDFEVSLKTIARDIDVLSLFPIVETQEGIDVYYELMEGARAPGLHLAPEEVAALVFGRELLTRALEDTPYLESFEALMAKIERQQRGHAHRKLARLPEVFQVASSSARTLRRFESGALEELIDAALTRRLVWMRYFASYRQATSERVVEPFLIHHSAHGLRLIAWCRLREAPRTFNLNQIKALRVLDDVFEVEPHRAEIEAMVSRSFDDMGSGPVVDVRLHIRTPTAHWARDRLIHPTQQIEDVEDGVIISFRSAGEPAIAARVLGLGPDCEVLAPESLRQLVADRAQAIAARHEGSPET